jgi:hypothetical protein
MNLGEEALVQVRECIQALDLVVPLMNLGEEALVQVRE